MIAETISMEGLSPRAAEVLRDVLPTSEEGTSYQHAEWRVDFAYIWAGRLTDAEHTEAIPRLRSVFRSSNAHRDWLVSSSTHLRREADPT